MFVGDHKLYLRGTTYGTFRPRADGSEVPEPDVVERDFAGMAAHGFNAVRVYTVPPRWLLDAAQRHGLRVMVGVPVERYIGFLADKRKDAPDLAEIVRAAVRACADHPAVLCYAIGNEIPAPVARWFGRRKVERFLERLYRVAKEEAPDSLVTYVNYPSTEYLQLDFLDFLCFNVYLESQERLQAYLGRLHTLAGERPVVMSELGLDSRRNGEHLQARTLDWQVRSAFAGGCAGAFVYAWTDEWYRSGEDVRDWDFGVTRRDRRSKPALSAVREAFVDVPFAPTLPWPRASVVICSYNGSRTLADCLDGVARLEYPDYEVVVVDDGSTDQTATIARQYQCRLIRTPNRGLASARNTGLAAATGEIVAYLDDDARPDPHWLSYLASTFLGTSHAAVGGPNVAPPGDGAIADSVARPAAMVWHHRRNSIRAYWRQQLGYGRAEAMLERKWPEKYNGPGYVRWAGRLYGPGRPEAPPWRRARVYHGIWGVAPYQSLYEPAAGLLGAIPQMPDWHLALVMLGGVAALGVAWAPLRFVVPLLGVGVLVSLAQAGVSAARAPFPTTLDRWPRLQRRLLTGVLHLLQPIARLRGRLKEGLTPWRSRGVRGPAPLWPMTTRLWSGQWAAPDARLQAIEGALRSVGACVLRGGPHDRWDLEVRGGFLGAARILMAVEEHGGGCQLVRIRAWPVIPLRGPLLSAGLAATAIAALHDHAWGVAAVLGIAAILPVLKGLEEIVVAMASVLSALRRLRDAEERPRG